jgi:hypothetical protein
MHHAFVIEAGREEGIALARTWVSENVGSDAEVVPLQHGLLSVDDARRVVSVANQTSAEASHRVLIITADRAYHEAQNALLKVFEEPPAGAVLFLILPSLGGLLPTLRSRVQVLQTRNNLEVGLPSETVSFLKMSKEKRSAVIKKLASGKDDDERREHREEAIALVNGVEQIAHTAMHKKQSAEIQALLSDISTLREHLYDRSAPVKMILEHLSIVIPKNLV